MRIRTTIGNGEKALVEKLKVSIVGCCTSIIVYKELIKYLFKYNYSEAQKQWNIVSSVYGIKILHFRFWMVLNMPHSFFWY